MFGLIVLDRVKAVLMALVCLLAFTATASAEYNRTPDSAINLDIFRIKEQKFIGTKIDQEYKIVDQGGNVHTIGEFYGKALVLVLSYYKCDGVCSAVNADLKELLKGVKRNEIGKDFNVLTISFDKYDTQESMDMFAKMLDLSTEMTKGWKLTLANDPEGIKTFTDKLGFKYFWSPRDKTFFHPNVYVVITPQGRVARYLYANTISSRDVEMSLLEARAEQTKPNEIIDLVVGYCYSYNYKEGKYSLNIPLFVAVGSLTIGVTAFIVSAVLFKKSNQENV